MNFLNVILISLIVLLHVTFGQEDTIPRGIHLSWNNSNTVQSSVIVLWYTKNSTGTALRFGTLANSYSTITSTNTGKYHRIQLLGLIPNTIYHYRVGDGFSWSSDNQFKTAPQTSTGLVRYCAFADLRTNRLPRQQTMEVVRRMKPTFSTIAGDLIETHSLEHEWWEFVDDLEPFSTTSPIAVVRGNHEGSSPLFLQLFAPGTIFDLTYDIVHFVFLDYQSETVFSNSQRRFLNTSMKASTANWKMLVMHTPVYSSRLSRNYTNIQLQFLPYLTNLNIDAVWSGHDHFYEHLTNNVTDFFITGAAGAPLYTLPANRLPLSIYGKSTHHTALIECTTNQMYVRTVERNFNVIERWVVRRTQGPDLRVDNIAVETSTGIGVNTTFIIEVINTGNVSTGVSCSGKLTRPDESDFIFTIPSLSPMERKLYEVSWIPNEIGRFLWTIEVDIYSQITETVEVNNKFTHEFVVTDPLVLISRGEIWTYWDRNSNPLISITSITAMPTNWSKGISPFGKLTEIGQIGTALEDSPQFQDYFTTTFTPTTSELLYLHWNIHGNMAFYINGVQQATGLSGKGTTTLQTSSFTVGVENNIVLQLAKRSTLNEYLDVILSYHDTHDFGSSDYQQNDNEKSNNQETSIGYSVGVAFIGLFISLLVVLL